MPILRDFRQDFDGRFTAFLAERFGVIGSISSDAAIARSLAAMQRMAVGGKRLRPFMCMTGYWGMGGDDARAWEVAIGLECFQLFCLLQDDVIDRSPTRHGQLSLHAALAADARALGREGDVGHAANGRAMLLADVYFAWAQQLWTQYAMPHGTAILPIVRRMIDEVIVGQLLDVDMTQRPRVSMAAVEEKTRLKTAGYSFVHPLQIGMALAGANDVALQWAASFGMALGVAFQLQDDLLDVYGDPAVLQKDTLGDVREGQRTVLTQYIADHGTTSDRDALAEMLGNAQWNDVEATRALFANSGAKAFCEARMREQFAAAEDALRLSPLSADHTAALADVVQKIAARYV